MNTALIIVLRVLAGIGLMLVNGVVLIYMLRKVLGHLHLRYGPMENGWHGITQTIFDVLKLFTKEDLVPASADRALFFLAPAAVFIPSLAAYAALPFSNTAVMANLDLGLLYTFAIMSIIPLGILMAGWASNNKWSLIGAMRAVGAQVTYEVPMLLAALPVAMMARSLNLGDIVRAQHNVWFIVNVPAFILFFIAGHIESNQTPFDLTEGESEIVCGYATEYSSMKFGFLFLSEFSNMFIFSALLVTLFFGGWQVPFVPAETLHAIWLFPPVIFMIKTYLMITLLMCIRGTMPRIRVDQLLNLGWKFLLPASIVWLMVTGVVLKLGSTMFGGAH
jgi:NADH-quinone oxidoreductase subunit H